MKKKILKIVGIIIAIIVVIILVHIIKNTIIISKLQKNIKEYTAKTNYYTKSNTQIDENTTMEIKQYQKDDKKLAVLERISNGEKVTMSLYDNGKRKDRFVETKDNKIAQLNRSDELLGLEIINPLQTENLWQTIIMGITAKIKNTELNGKKCYIVSNFYSPYYLSGENRTDYYIEKETGLVLKSNIDGTTIEREYEFDNVEDSIFVEPDIGKYELK